MTSSMTLKQWAKPQPIQFYYQGPGVVVPDIPNLSDRSQLWDLEDYTVTSVHGGSIWLMPKRLTDRRPEAPPETVQ